AATLAAGEDEHHSEDPSERGALSHRGHGVASRPRLATRARPRIAAAAALAQDGRAVRTALAVMLISACTPTLGAPHDASPRLDAGPGDASPHDASPHDASPHDASPHDAS